MTGAYIRVDGEPLCVREKARMAQHQQVGPWRCYTLPVATCEHPDLVAALAASETLRGFYPTEEIDCVSGPCPVEVGG